jgi:hypothetical protein
MNINIDDPALCADYMLVYYINIDIEYQLCFTYFTEKLNF